MKWGMLAGTALVAATFMPAVSAAQQIGRPDTGVAVSAAADEARARTVIVARVARSARKHQPRLDAFAGWLASRLGEAGIIAGAGYVARNPREMITLFKEGRIDVVSESILTALRYEDETGAEIARHEWRDGEPYYQSVFIAHNRGSVYSLKDLVGRRIAFEDRGSTSAFLLPLAVMIRAGLKPVEMPRHDAPVPAGAVGYVFAGSETNISAWVAGGIVEVGAYSNRDWDRKKANPNRYRKHMRVFQVTQPLPRSMLLLRSGIKPALRRAILQALDEFGTARDAVEVRDRYYDVARFAPISGALVGDIADARDVYRTVRHFLE